MKPPVMRMLCATQILQNITSVFTTHLRRTLSRNTGYISHAAASASNSDREKWRDEGVLYVHWPYCKKRCTYCNFNKYIREDVDHNRMRKCLVEETRTLLNLSSVKRIKSIFFGGGTPSLAEPETIQRIIETVQRTKELTPGGEITLEANPTSAETQKLINFKEVGINRISLGVQALNDEDLHVLGRQHTATEALRCLEVCKDLFPGRTSIDIIFGRPGQKIDDWSKELDQAFAVCDDHLSVYQLTLEKGTPLFRQIMDRELAVPSQDSVAEMYEMIVKKAKEMGFHRYEVSNFAKTEVAESVHNTAYWQSTQYIGVGPGAHGRFLNQTGNEPCREARIQTLVPETWMENVEKLGHGTLQVVKQDERKILPEVLMLGLRTAKGISHKNWALFTDISLYDLQETYMYKILQEEGFLTLDANGLRPTDKGMNVADGITAELITIVDTLTNR